MQVEWGKCALGYIYKNRGEVKSQNYNGDQLINHNMKGLLHKVFENHTNISWGLWDNSILFCIMLWTILSCIMSFIIFGSLEYPCLVEAKWVIFISLILCHRSLPRPHLNQLFSTWGIQFTFLLVPILYIVCILVCS